MRELIRTLAPTKAIVVSTHILEEVEAICTRAIVIARGKMLADCTPAELLARAPARDPDVHQLVRTTRLEDAFRHITLEQAGS
jgi:ABC-2 type transport system ATP-binding protein